MWRSPRQELLAEHVLRAVEQVPPGRVCSYGDIAEIVGCGARQVGHVMRFSGGSVCWWRIVNHAGDLTVIDEARPYWDAEGIQLKPNGLGCRIADYRADLRRVAEGYAAAVADLPALAACDPTEAVPTPRNSPPATTVT